MADLIYYVGPTSNIAGITPDYLTLADWWTNVPKDLVTRQQRCIVNLLPGLQEFNGTLEISGATTNSTYYFYIKALSGYRFNGDVSSTKIPIVKINNVASNSSLITSDSDYLRLEGFLLTGTNNDITNVFVLIPNNFILVDSICVHDISVTSTADFLLIFGGEKVIIRNCVINKINLTNDVAYTSAVGFYVIAPFNLDNSFVHNNTISNITVNYSGVTYDCLIICFGGGNSGSILYHNNLFFNFSIANSSGGNSSIGDAFELPPNSSSSYHAFDSLININISSNTNVITASDEVVNTSNNGLDCHLKIGTTINTNGVDITTLVKPTAMPQSLFDFAIASPFYDIDAEKINTFSRGADKRLIEMSMDEIGFEIPSNNYNNSLNDISGEEMSFEITKRDFVLNSFRKVR